MHIARSVKELQDTVQTLNANNNKIVGFIPTMGALHQGHINLVNEALKRCDVVVCSIFVNPTQFNDLRDFEKYPRNNAADIEALSSISDVVVYFPQLVELYPENKQRLIDYNDKLLFNAFEGEFRPGHFLGVVTVVLRLFEHVLPNMAFFGLKDYQQFLVIKRAASNYFPNTSIIGLPTVRNTNGLALSSRNQRLSEQQLVQAEVISQVLGIIAKNGRKKNIDTITQEGLATLADAGLRAEYLAICNAKNLQKIHHWHEANDYVAVCAAFVGEVRLIDNILF